jgi:hypothetical protein
MVNFDKIKEEIEYRIKYWFNLEHQLWRHTSPYKKKRGGKT